VITSAETSELESLDGIREVIFDQPTIENRVCQMGREVSRDYGAKELFVIGILKGAFIFTCDLVRQLPFLVESDFMALSCYNGVTQAEEVQITLDLQKDIEGKHVLVVEDIVDTGLTLNYLLSILRERRPASLAVCTLLDRPELRLTEIPIRYVGFQVDQDYLVGYGLDFRDYYRDLPFVATMNVECAKANFNS